MANDLHSVLSGASIYAGPGVSVEGWLPTVANGAAWTRYDMPPVPSTAGGTGGILGLSPYGGTKHTRWERRTVDGCWYVLGGDYTGGGFGDATGPNDASGIHYLWKVTVTPGASPPFTWQRMNNFIPPAGVKIPARVDEAPWMYDSRRDRFLLFPMPRWVEALSPDIIIGHLMMYDPKTNVWTDTGTGLYTVQPGDPGYVPERNPQFDANGHQYPIGASKWGFYDAVTDKYWCWLGDSVLMAINAETLVMDWPHRELSRSGDLSYYNHISHSACLCVDRVRRAIVYLKPPIGNQIALDPDRGWQLCRYYIDTGTFDTVPSTNRPFDIADVRDAGTEALCHDERTDNYLYYGSKWFVGNNVNVERMSNVLRALPATGGQWRELLPVGGVRPIPLFCQTMWPDPKLGKLFELGGIGAAEQSPEMWTVDITAAQAPQITGTTWTPRRDGNGDVLQTEFASLPLGQWLKVETATLMQAVPVQAGYTNGTGSDGTGNIVAPWGGAAWDAQGQVMYLNGGGHGDAHICETEILSVEAKKLTYGLGRDRAPLNQAQYWDTNTNALVDGVAFPPFNMPLKNGTPSSDHTYWGLVHVPGSVFGNTKGALFRGGMAKEVVNLDTGLPAGPTWWKSPAVTGENFSNMVFFRDGNAAYRLWGFNIVKFTFAGTQATTWNAASYGTYNNHATTNANGFGFGQSGKAICEMYERREVFHSYGTATGFTRTRVGQAADAGATDWAAYTDILSLTSADGSHADWTVAAHQDGTNLLNDAGMAYDDQNRCIWVAPNTSGSRMYRISGIASNAWNVEKLPAATAVLTASSAGTYGRFRIARFGSVTLGIRVSSAVQPIEVIRLI